MTNKTLSSEELEDLLLKIKDEDLRIKKLDDVSSLMSAYSLMYVIVRIDDNKKRIEVFDKYVNRFNTQNFMYMLMCLNDEEQEDFIDKHIAYFDGYSLTTIWKKTYKLYYQGVNRDRLLDKYIDKLDKLCLSLIIIDLVSYEYDYVEAIEYLLSKTQNDVTIENIYNAARAINPSCVEQLIQNKKR